LALAELHPFQANLKDLSTKDFVKLRQQIIDTGFSYPFFVWRDCLNQKWYLIDGHQRLRVLWKLEEEGFILPKFFKCVPIEAANYKEARVKLLQCASSYGKMSSQSLYEFSVTSDFNVEKLDSSFRFADINFHKFKVEFFDDPSINENPKSNSITCPYCKESFEKSESL
jgi:hypothetical protein